MGAWPSIHNATNKNIRASGPPDNKGVYGCGCQNIRDSWWLCTYHTGYEDALEDAEEAARGRGHKDIRPG